MPQEPIPFWNQQASGLDPLGGASPVAINVVSEVTGAIRRRPGVKAASGLHTSSLSASGILGIHETESGRLYAVAGGFPGTGRVIYRVDGGGLKTLGSDYTNIVIGDTRPVFSETEMLVVIAGGNTPQKIELSSDTSSRLGGDPPSASHICAISSRLLGNDIVLDKSNIRYSSTANGNTSYAGHEQWTQGVGTAGFFRAEARPDSVTALAENTNEVFAWGPTTLQIFTSDASFVFTPVATREVGLSAPYSVVKVDQSYFWLDDKRRFVMSDGRSFNVISEGIQRTLHEMGTVSDCFGYRVFLGPVDALVWTFPSDGRTFCYQKSKEGGGWSEWLGFDDEAANWTQFRVLSHCLGKSGTNYVGTTDGLLGELSLTTHTDIRNELDSPTTRVAASVTTGFINHGTDALKHCKRVRFRLRRGETTGASTPVAFFAYRDEPGPWSQRIPISLGSNADRYPVVEFHSLGTYRTRQWLFEFSDTSTELVLAGASEEFVVLNN